MIEFSWIWVILFTLFAIFILSQSITIRSYRYPESQMDSYENDISSDDSKEIDEESDSNETESNDSKSAKENITEQNIQKENKENIEIEKNDVEEPLKTIENDEHIKQKAKTSNILPDILEIDAENVIEEITDPTEVNDMINNVTNITVTSL